MMIKSMTGFGRGSVSASGRHITAQVRAVNGRFLDIKIRGMELDPSVEQEIRKMLSDSLQRGTIALSIKSVSQNGSGGLVFNRAKMKSIADAVASVEKEFDVSISLGDVIRADDLFSTSEEGETQMDGVAEAVKKACAQAEKMRKAEGKKLYKDLKSRTAVIKRSLKNLKKLADSETKSRSKKYASKVKDLAGGIEIDGNRMIQEIAILAEKADVTEEVVRIDSHMEQFTELLNTYGQVGKRLNFILQEVGREVNTVGSKITSDTGVNRVVGMKNELERMREQVQNVL
ncbi:MAG: YicC/YloC family endoribonuclease [Candidatus Marinimicrobia bacterium]|jgi:uncharacterized protein (TIGR00255 family)|nr:YicC/YloC family endoribonuclease [Candidatus Neomarinimicrobiota bacterium]MDP6789571.1 YicC/YloC family endoribonuclease [Candidatus Neomarinimicrobiota bacterium]MDP7071849.1 YicC/YloC family endoribonuclease [Candidatus Neomarinimicrobiota bacterium]